MRRRAWLAEESLYDNITNLLLNEDQGEELIKGT
jgi:hypothetical protein